MSKKTESKKKIFTILGIIAVFLVVSVLILYNQGFLDGSGMSADPSSDISTSEPPSLSEIHTTEPLSIKIGRSDYSYPPLHYYDEKKELVGFDIDLARAVAEIMAAEIEFVSIDWAIKGEALESGTVDLLWGGLSPSSSLDHKKTSFTKPYLRSDIVLLMDEDKDYAQFEDLQGLQVCALYFTAAFDYLQSYRKYVIKPKQALTPAEYKAVIRSLSSGEADCIITDTCFAAFFLRENEEPYKISDPLLEESYVVAVRAEDTELLGLLQGALDELEENGTINRLKEKWLS